MRGLASQLRRAHDDLADLAGMSRRRKCRSQFQESDLARRAASAHLRATRGYDVRPGTTPNRYGRPMGTGRMGTGTGMGMAHTMRSRGGSRSRTMMGSGVTAGLGSSMGSSRGIGAASGTRGGRPQTSKV